MTVRYSRPVSHSAYAARRIGLAALLLFLLAVVAHRFGPLRTPDFLALVLMSAAIAAAAVPLALIGLARLWQKGADGGIASAKALIYAGIPLTVVAVGAVFFFTRPPLHEVSTDIGDPPAFLVQPDYDQQWFERHAPTPSDREAQTQAYPGLVGRRYEGALDRVFEGVKAAVVSARIEIVHQEGAEQAQLQETPPVVDEEPESDAKAPGTVPIPLPRPEPSLAPPVFTASDVVLQGEARSLLFGLPFDVVIRLREDTETTTVDIRVASRYGAHDLGFSAAVAKDFLKRLDAELLGIAGG